MKSLLQEIPRVLVYLDDILITGKTRRERFYNLERVVGNWQEPGLRLSNKCRFMQKNTWGNVINASGLHPDKERTRAIETHRDHGPLEK